MFEFGIVEESGMWVNRVIMTGRQVSIWPQAETMKWGMYLLSR